MKKIPRFAGWMFLIIGLPLCLLGVLALPDGGLMFALPYFFLVPGIALTLIGGLLTWLARFEERRAGKELAAVCGLYCEACTLFIATKEDPARLKMLAGRFQMSEEEIRCHGCRSDKRGPYCRTCRMSACAGEKGIDFCVDCAEYPCADLKKFQSERPHRIELFDDLARIKAAGYERWLADARENYACPRCRAVNSAYDLKCRKCGHEPSCEYVARHKPEIEKALKNM